MQCTKENPMPIKDPFTRESNGYIYPSEKAAKFTWEHMDTEDLGNTPSDIYKIIRCLNCGYTFTCELPQ